MKISFKKLLAYPTILLINVHACKHIKSAKFYLALFNTISVSSLINLLAKENHLPLEVAP